MTPVTEEWVRADRMGNEPSPCWGKMLMLAGWLGLAVVGFARLLARGGSR